MFCRQSYALAVLSLAGVALLGVACGAVDSETSPTSRSAQTLESVEDGATVQGRAQPASSSEFRVVVDAAERESPEVAIAVPEHFRSRVRSVEFVPVSASGGADHEFVPERSEGAVGNLRTELPAAGVYDVVVRLEQSGEDNPVLGDEDESGPYAEALTTTDEPETSGDDERRGDPVPFPADRTRVEGETYNGDPVPVPAAPNPEESDSSEREGETDNGDPVPVPAEPADYEVHANGEERGSTEVEGYLFEGDRTVEVIVPNLHIGTGRHRALSAEPRNRGDAEALDR